VRNLGRERITAFRLRMNELRRDTDTALSRTELLEAQVEALRREVAGITTAVGDQLATLSAAIEQLERALAGDRDGTSDHDP
jgi:hypothetical protein